ncbi:MAG TPA: class I SAM-dependent methyltransferase [Rhodothermales bacterium]
MASFILDKAHEVVRGSVGPGDTAIDATVGNGWDTIFLARLVGPDGRVVGFDVQTTAIDAARRRLAAEDLLERCWLFEESHEAPARFLEAAGAGRPAAIMFNLGYLPGGDRSITTSAATTIRSLNRMVDLLTDGGVITVVAYKGHRGATEEVDELEEWSAALDRKRFNCELIEDPTGPPHAPILFVVRKLSSLRAAT